MDKVASSSSRKPDSEAEGRKGIAMWTTVAVLMFGLAMALPFVGRQIYHRYRTYRAESVAAEATRLLNEERWEAASQVLKEDFKTYGKEPAIMRALGALFIDGYDDPLMGSNLLRQVLASGQATFDDIRKLAMATLRMGDTPEARRLYETLPDAEKSNRKGLELLSEIQRQAGEPVLAEKTLRKALAIEPEDARSQFRLALLDEAGAFEVSKTVASQAVWNVARRGDSLALEAVAHLCTSPSLTAAQAQELLVLVEQNPKSAPRDRYRVLGAQLRLRPMERERVIAAEVSKNKGKAAESLFDFLRWLGTEKQYERIIELVQVNTALHDPDVFLVYVDALSAAERWKELLEVIEQPKVPVSGATRYFISAECYAHLNPDLIKAGEHIEKVYAIAGLADQQAVVRAAALAESKGLNDLAIMGYSKVAEARPNMRVGMLERVLELQHREKDVRAIVGTLRHLRDLRPTNHAYTDHLNYLRLLTGDEMELAYQAVLGFEKPVPHTDESSAVPQVLLRALAAQRMGDTARVATEVKTFNPDMRLAAGQRAVMAGIVAAAGDDVGAFRMAEGIPRALLLPEELVFLSRAMR